MEQCTAPSFVVVLRDEADTAGVRVDDDMVIAGVEKGSKADRLGLARFTGETVLRRPSHRLPGRGKRRASGGGSPARPRKLYLVLQTPGYLAVQTDSASCATGKNDDGLEEAYDVMEQCTAPSFVVVLRDEADTAGVRVDDDMVIAGVEKGSKADRLGLARFTGETVLRRQSHRLPGRGKRRASGGGSPARPRKLYLVTLSCSKPRATAAAAVQTEPIPAPARSPPPASIRGAALPVKPAGPPAPPAKGRTLAPGSPSEAAGSRGGGGGVGGVLEELLRGNAATPGKQPAGRARKETGGISADRRPSADTPGPRDAADVGPAKRIPGPSGLSPGFAPAIASDSRSVPSTPGTVHDSCPVVTSKPLAPPSQPREPASTPMHPAQGGSLGSPPLNSCRELLLASPVSDARGGNPFYPSPRAASIYDIDDELTWTDVAELQRRLSEAKREAKQLKGQMAELEWSVSGASSPRQVLSV
ncbi:hypothetical protein DIPPA_05955 [Diplonema papillatum]|nr:hypothetical protein DIPPA_05955 [Diplonema papillatum]